MKGLIIIVVVLALMALACEGENIVTCAQTGCERQAGQEAVSNMLDVAGQAVQPIGDAINQNMDKVWESNPDAQWDPSWIIGQ